jgi:hypothetical protein
MFESFNALGEALKNMLEEKPHYTTMLVLRAHLACEPLHA